MSHIWNMIQSMGNCTEWPQMTLTFSRSKIPMCVLQIPPPPPRFSRFILWLVIFWATPLLGMVHRIACYIDPWSPNSHPFNSTTSLVIFDWHRIFRKNAGSDPKCPWHVQFQKYQYACYIHPDFRPFHSTMSHFELQPCFQKSATKDPKWPWHVQGQK